MTDTTSLDCIMTTSSIIGDKWTPQLIYIIDKAEQIRFCQLQRQANDINPRTLSARLAKLEQDTIIQKSDGVYSLTKRGVELIPVLKQMEAWGRVHS